MKEIFVLVSPRTEIEKANSKAILNWLSYSISVSGETKEKIKY